MKKKRKVRPRLARKLEKVGIEDIKQTKSIWVRIFHWGFAISTIFIIITGLELHQPAEFLNISYNHIFIVHISAAWIALGCLAFRMVDAILNKDKSFIPTARDIKAIPKFLAYNFFLRDELPPSGRYNVGEKFIFISWILLTVIASIFGIISYTGGKQLTWLFYMIGGFQTIRWTKYLIAIYFAATIPLHIYLVLTQNLSRLQSIISGYERRN